MCVVFLVVGQLNDSVRTLDSVQNSIKTLATLAFLQLTSPVVNLVFLYINIFFVVLTMVITVCEVTYH